MGIFSPGYNCDIMLVNSSGSPYGYQTMPASGNRSVVDTFRKALGSSDDPRYSDMQVTRIHAQTDWHSGHGELHFSNGTFYYGRNVMTRASNRALLGPSVTLGIEEKGAGMRPFKWILPFKDGNNVRQMVAVAEDGSIYTQTVFGGNWTAGTGIGCPPASVVVFPGGTPSVDYMGFGFDSYGSYGLYTRWPGTPSRTQIPWPNQWGAIAPHRGLLYDGVGNRLLVNSLAAPFATTDLTLVGDTQYPISYMYSMRGMLFIGKADGLWCIENTDAAAPKPYCLLDYTANPNINNFRYMVEKDGNLVVSVGNDVLEISGDFAASGSRVARAIGPFHKRQLPKHFYGEITGITKTLDGLLVGVNAGASGIGGVYAYNGTGWNMERSPVNGILTGSYMGQNITALSAVVASPYAAHPSVVLAQFDSLTSTAGQYTRAIYVFKQFDADGVSYPLSTNGQTFFNSAADGITELVSIWDANLPGIPKWLDKINVIGTLPPGSSVTVSYQLDPPDVDNLSWTVLGTASNTSGAIARSDLTDLSFPAGTTCRQIAIRVVLNLGTATYESPIMEAYTLAYLLRPAQTKVYRYVLNLRDPYLQNAPNRDETISLQERADALFSMHAQQAPVSLYRREGTVVRAYRVMLDAPSEQESNPNHNASDISPRGYTTSVSFVEV